MIGYNLKDKPEIIEKINIYQKENNYKYLSVSNILDVVSCSHKKILREKYNFVKLETLIGSLMHLILKEISCKMIGYYIENKIENEGYWMHFNKIKNELLSKEKLEQIYDYCFDFIFKDTPLKIITQQIFVDESNLFLEDYNRILLLKENLRQLIIPENFDKLIDEPILYHEIEGVEEIKLFDAHTLLLYGIIDRISLDKNNNIVIMDYKFKFKKERVKTDLGHILQLWVYNYLLNNSEFNKDNKKFILRYIKVEIPQKELLYMSQDEYLQKLNSENKKVKKIKNFDFNIEVEDKEIIFSNTYDEIFKNKLMTAHFINKYNYLGVIGESKYGCKYCAYKTKCKYSKDLIEENEEEEK